MTSQAYLVNGCRTPIGKIGGKLKKFQLAELVSPLVHHLISNSKLNPSEIDDFILGNVVGEGGNIARLSLLASGLPVEVPGVTVDRQCGAGLESINLTAHRILAGDGHIFLAGGVESCSREPWKLHRSLDGGPPQIIERPPFAPDTMGDPDMGEAAEMVAEMYNISRQKQDAFALRSHTLAVQTAASGKFAEFIIPPLGLTEVKDEGPRSSMNEKLLSRMPPAFREKGSVTAGNSCFKSDGAALALIVSEDLVRQWNIKPMARYVASAVSGVDPKLPGLGPIAAVPKVLRKANLKLEDIGLVEINEAFAAKVLACRQELGLPEEKVNVNGGSIAFGHPYGATGTIMTLHLLAEMRLSRVRYGLVTMGIGGGLGIATIWENPHV